MPVYPPQLFLAFTHPQIEPVFSLSDTPANRAESGSFSRVLTVFSAWMIGRTAIQQVTPVAAETMVKTPTTSLLEIAIAVQ